MMNVTSPIARARRGLRTPLAVLVVLPLLVLSTGAGTAWIGHQRLSRFAIDQAGARLVDAGGGLVRAAESLVTGVDPILDRWREAVRRVRQGDERARWEEVLGDLMTANPWITWLSFTATTGELRGARRDGARGVVLVQKSLADGGRVREWTFDSLGRPQLQRDERGRAVDPRSSRLWQMTMANGRRQWTVGQTVASTGEPGFVRAEPFFADDGTPVGMIALDLSLTRLKDRMRAAANDIGAELVLLDGTGSVLLDTDGNRVGGNTRLSLFHATAQHADRLAQSVDDEHGRILVHCRDIALADGLQVRLGMVAPLEPLLAEAQGHLRTGLGVTALFIVIASAIAVAYGRMIVRARAAAVAAQQVADKLGAYVLERQVGSGGMGEVWQARHRRLAFPAALKLIRRDSLDTRDPERARQRFIREAQAMAKLTSPHTVRVFDYGELDDGTLYYAMELIDGLNLEVLVERRGPLTPGAVVAVLLAACDSLAEAHRHGLVHRDVKPSNLLVCRAGDRADVVKLIDFGLVVDMAQDQGGPRLTQAGFVAGTPGFASPEQMRGEPLDGRSDLYALGCLAFWLLTRRQVFPASSLVEEMRRHLEEPAPSVARFAALQIPVGLDEIIQTLLAKRPEDRPRDAAALRGHLLACGVRADPAGLTLKTGEGLAECSATAGAVVVRPRAVRSDD